MKTIYDAVVGKAGHHSVDLSSFMSALKRNEAMHEILLSVRQEPIEAASGVWEVPVGDILFFNVFSITRARRCAQKYGARQRPPTVHLSAYFVAGRRYYAVSDGTHRCATAYILYGAEHRIKAEVSCIVRPDMTRYAILAGMLTEAQRDGSARILRQSLSRESIAAAVDMGIQKMASPAQMWDAFSMGYAPWEGEK